MSGGIVRGMLTGVHYVLMAWYLAGPAVALAIVVTAARRERRWVAAIVGWSITMGTGVVLGGSMAAFYAIAVDGTVRLGQVLLASYFAAGMLFLLKGFDYLLRRLTGARRRGATARRTDGTAEMPPPSSGGNSGSWGFRQQMGFVLRVVLLFAIGLPYVMAAVMTYRPKVGLGRTPSMVYEAVDFRATDGMRLSGWWIPAEAPPEGAPEDWGGRTLLVCHGLAANKSNHLVMGQWGPTRGFNVFIFDFRAHGESGGQLTTFGDRERYDVLGAVRWLKENRAEESRRIVGIGASMGAAALVMAAADPGVEGQSIDAVVAYGTYARLGRLARSVADQHFAWPLNVLVKYVAVPMASAQVKSNLGKFEPVARVADIWPRPIMVIHGLRDEIIPFEQGEWLYEAAAPPREFRPISQAGHNDIMDDRNVQEEVQRFAETAERVPVL